jgi:hypothetical protein
MRHQIKLHFRAETKRKEYRLVIYKKNYETGRIAGPGSGSIQQMRRLQNTGPTTWFSNLRRLVSTESRNHIDKMKVDFLLMKSPPHVSEESARWYEHKIEPLFIFFQENGYLTRDDISGFDYVSFYDISD